MAKSEKNMTTNLLLEDTLLYIASILIAFGAIALEPSFIKGIIALIIAAGLIVARAYLKKKAILELKAKLK